MYHLNEVIKFDCKVDKVEIISETRIKITLANNDVDLCEQLRTMNGVKAVLFDQSSYYLVIKPSVIDKFVIQK